MNSRDGVIVFLLLLSFRLSAQTPDQRAEQIQNGLFDIFMSADQSYYKHNNASDNDPYGYGYWVTAHGLETLADAYQRTRNPVYKDRMKSIIAGIRKYNSYEAGTYHNDYYDDLEWLCLAAFNCYNATQDPDFLEAVHQIWVEIKTGYGNGAMSWKKGCATPCNNSIANGPAIVIAVKLYQLEGDNANLQMAKDIYAWMKANVFNADGGIWDAPDNHNEDWQFSYNSGMFIAACLELSLVTNQQLYVEDGIKACEYMMNLRKYKDGVFFLNENGQGDGGLFKGIFAKYFIEFVRVAELTQAQKERYLEVIHYTGNYAWGHSVDKSSFLISPDWSALPVGTIDLSTQVSGVHLFESIASLNKVHVYQDINYSGFYSQLPVGTYTLAQLQAKGIADNVMTSLTVPLGYAITVYENDNFTGASKTFSANAPWLDDWNDRISSVKIAGISTSSNAVVYSDCSFSGNAIGLAIGTYSRARLNSWGIFDNDISSIKVAGGNKVVVFSDDDLSGDSFLLTANNECLTFDNWDSKIASLKIVAISKSFMAGDNIAAFYPSNFDSLGTLPSFILKDNIHRTGTVPNGWAISPLFSIENGKNVVTISYNGHVDFYGNGEVTGALKRNGTNITLWNSENPNYWVDNGKRLYQSHPWLMGVRSDGSAFGIIADNTWRQDFSVSNHITITSDGPGFRVIVIERNNPQELIQAFTDLTGRIELPALWTLGYQQSRFSYTPASQVSTIADEFRRRKIPCDVLWMDIDYMDQYKIFTFNPSTFGDPKGLNNYLHSKNFKAVYMIDPGVKKQSGYFVYDQGIAGNHWVKKSDGAEFNGQVWPPVVSFPDFTRPETRTWWASLYDGFMANGIDGVWNDMNEPSVFDTPNKTMPETNLHAGGGDLPEGTHARYHNVYGYLMVKASREGIAAANPDKRPFILSRSNFLGGHRYAATWTGDNLSTWAHLKLSIPMSITLGLSGQPVSGSDIGGFNSNCSGDLLGHWMALGAYYPFSRNHSGSGSTSQEPWAFGSEIEKVSRTAVNRRYRLLPYMYTLLNEASQTGMPLMRPVFFADNSDLSLRDEQQAFLLGKDLLVVPKWASNPKLPQGDWDRLKLESVEDNYQANLFIRPGSVIPLGNIIQSTAEYLSDSVTLLMNPLESGMASGVLYHDDGDGYQYQSSNYAMHEFLVSKHKEDSLKVVINQIGGSKIVNRVYRIGYVTDNGIAYSSWFANTVHYVAIIKDRNSAVNLNSINAMYAAGNFVTGLMPMKHMDEKKWKLDSVYFQAGRMYTLRFSQSRHKNVGLKWGASTGLAGNVSIIRDTLSDVTFLVPSTDFYTIAFDQSTLRYVIQKTPKLNSLAIVGDATTSLSWDLIGHPMSQSIEDLNVFTWVGALVTSNGNTEGKFKFHSGTKGNCEDVWLYSSVPDQSLSASSLVIVNGCSTDNKWKVLPGQNGTYKITINTFAKTISIQKLLNSLAIVGDATIAGWNTTGLSMQQAPDQLNVFTWTGTLSAGNGSTTDGKFKFHSGSNGFCDDRWLYATTPDQSLSRASLIIASGCSVADNQWKVQPNESGSYKITVDVDARTIKMQRLITSLSIVGDATSNGWATNGLPMQQSVDNSDIFTWTGMLSASNGTTEGKFKFHSGNIEPCDDTWLYAMTPDQSLSATSITIVKGCDADDNKWKVQPSESGNYTITIDIAKRTIKIQKIINTLSIVGDATSVGWDPKGLVMQQSGTDDHVFTWIGLLSEGNGASSHGEFKFHSVDKGLCDDTWLYATTSSQSLSATTFVMANGCTVDDNKWKVKAGETGTYRIIINLDSKVVKIQKVILSSLSIVGDATYAGWNTMGLPMQQSVDDINIFTWTGKLSESNGITDGKFKFHSGTNGFCDDVWLYGSDADQSLSGTTFVMANGCSVADNKWRVKPTETGTYNVTVDLRSGAIKIRKVILVALSIVGDATSVGWNPTGLPMTQSVDEPNTFTWTGMLSASNGSTEGKFKFHAGTGGFCDDVWLYGSVVDQSLSDTGFAIVNGCSASDNKWKVKADETNIYLVSVNLESKVVDIKNISVADPETVTGAGQLPESLVSVEAFPNPAPEYVVIRISGSAKAPSKIVLYDLTGRKICSVSDDKLNTKEIVLPMTQLARGEYILKVEMLEGIIVRKIIK